MIKDLTEKIKESAKSILPIAALVIVTSFLPFTHLSAKETITFIISAALMIIGVSLFDLGAGIAMTPMGDQIGAGLTKSRKISVLLGISFLMGMLLSMAEPDLSVLAGQVSAVINPSVFIVSVGIGVGLLLMIAVFKIFTNVELGRFLMLAYCVIFALTALLIENGRSIFIPLSLDSGGVTGGPVTVPFVMALGIGAATVAGGRKTKENSFGLLALCSLGAIVAVLILSLTSKGTLIFEVKDYSLEGVIEYGIGRTFLETAWGVLKSLALILFVFMILNFLELKLPKKKLIMILIGIAYTFVGLSIFLTAVQIGFLPVGYLLGTQLAEYSPVALVVFGLITGMVAVLAEPSVHILTNQVEEATGGTVSKKSMTIALSAGVGISIALAMIRVIFGFTLLYYIVPGYLIALLLSILVPGMYSAIAFDSGGVASGSITSSFVLPLTIGACMVLSGEDSILSDAFGIVAMVAMTPLITIQFLGFRAIAKRKIREKGVIRKIMKAEDEQIIYFDV